MKWNENENVIAPKLSILGAVQFCIPFFSNEQCSVVGGWVGSASVMFIWEGGWVSQFLTEHCLVWKKPHTEMDSPLHYCCSVLILIMKFMARNNTSNEIFTRLMMDHLCYPKIKHLINAHGRLQAWEPKRGHFHISRTFYGIKIRPFFGWDRAKNVKKKTHFGLGLWGEGHLLEGGVYWVFYGSLVTYFDRALLQWCHRQTTWWRCRTVMWSLPYIDHNHQGPGTLRCRRYHNNSLPGPL